MWAAACATMRRISSRPSAPEANADRARSAHRLAPSDGRRRRCRAGWTRSDRSIARPCGEPVALNEMHVAYAESLRIVARHCQAAADASHAHTSISGRCCAIANAIAPLPVPCPIPLPLGADAFQRQFNQQLVSGRGINVAGVTLRLIPKNSRVPRI